MKKVFIVIAVLVVMSAASNSQVRRIKATAKAIHKKVKKVIDLKASEMTQDQRDYVLMQIAEDLGYIKKNDLVIDPNTP